MSASLNTAPLVCLAQCQAGEFRRSRRGCGRCALPGPGGGVRPGECEPTGAPGLVYFSLMVIEPISVIP